MQINAIRLAGVGRFRDGVALEGFAPGLNVLAAPNEAGKSTLLRALRTLFTVAHSSRGQKLETMRADGAAAARIQCDFTIADVPWRLTKQYLAGRSAELVRVDTGETWGGGDAEDRLTALTAGPGGLVSTLPSLWVAQGESFAPPAVSDDHRKVFQDLVRAEMDAATGAGRLVQIHARAKADLAKLVTAGRAQPRGAYLDARRALSEAGEQLAALEDKSAKSADRRRQRDVLIAREQTLADPAAEAARQKALADTLAALEAARDARQKRDVAVARRAEAEADYRTALAALQTFDTTVAELRAGHAKVAQLTAEITVSEQRLGQIDAEIAACDVRLADLRKQEAEARAAQLAASQAMQRRALLARQSELSERLAQARGFAAEMSALDAKAPSAPPSPADLDALRKVEDEIRALEARAQAIAPNLAVAYKRDAKGQFHIAGEALADGDIRPVRAAVRIEADGIGVITVEPANADGEEIERRLAHHRTDLAALLKRLGVTDRATGEARAVAAVEHGRLRADVRVRLEAVAPGGIDKLVAQVDALARDVAALPDQPETCRDVADDASAIHERLATATQLQTEAAAQRERHSLAREHARDELARARASVEALKGRLAQLTGALPPEGAERDAARRSAAATLAEAEVTLHTLTREVDAWAVAALDDRQFAERQAERANAEQQVRAAAAELGEVRASRREIEGALRRDIEDGVEAAVAVARQTVDRLRERVTGFETEVAGLGRLVQVAELVIAEQRAQMAGPIAIRMQALAAHVFPGMTFRLGPDFS
ncbi:MAG: AAA family ATPase, partial [Hyphomicrobiaceae bacterium]|nr:AAA family ATPase [Hyphomicrobiaceae bacterium]